MFCHNKENIPREGRIFCNRSLNMWDINAVGFDMDYTLALYKPEEFETISYNETIKKLIQIGYPAEILKWKFDANYMIRGLVIDKKRGNILKIDRHRYVKRAYHGFQELSRDERRQIYDLEKVISYEEPDFVLMDTVFVFAEAYLFSQLVDLKENSSHLKDKNFVELYVDIKKCIDLVHRDGSLKDKVAQNPGAYINKDPQLAFVLETLRLSGKKLFLLTNSLWAYTDVVMNYVLSTDTENTQNWTDYFDIIITGSQKPHFFKSHNPMYEVDLNTQLLRNIEVLPVLSAPSPLLSDTQNKVKTTLWNISTEGLELQGSVKSNSKVFQGGHVNLLHDMLDVQKGSEILYIGDHIYGDILRSKKEIGWRTMLVIEELESEVSKIAHLDHQRRQCDMLSELRENCDDRITQLELELNDLTKKIKNKADENLFLHVKEVKEKIAAVEKECIIQKEQEKQAMHDYQKSFHPLWGQMMKTGKQNSRFSSQVINYSCLYTSKLSNLVYYGVNKNFQSSSDNMPHD